MAASNSSSRTSKAERFHRVRSDHRTETAEDYVELILDEIELDGRAQLSELAKTLGVAHPTVSKALKRIATQGLVIIQPYNRVELTAKGKALALAARKRHAALVNFLLAIGIDKKTAEKDAEGMEHHVSEKTLRAMVRFCGER